MNVNNLINTFLESKSFMETVWDILSDKVAIIVYVVIILALIIIVAANLIISEYKKPIYEFKTKEDVKELKKNHGVALDHEMLSDKEEKPIEVTLSDVNIKKTSSKEDENDGNRFYMLNELDKLDPTIGDNLFVHNLTLEGLCEDFRNFCSYKLHLYYDIKDIRRFIASLAVTHILILQGMSGTGKTSLAYAFGEYISNKTVVIPIQPMWKERTDLIGYYNEFTKKFNETTLLEKLYEANIKRDVYITVLDEMNIARVEYYFAEFLSLLELPNPDVRNLDVVSDVWESDPKLLHEGRLRLPENMYFIGTANNDDSTFAISDKVYDRAMVINLDYKSEPFEGKKTESIHLSYEDLSRLFKEAASDFEISKRNLLKLSALDKYMIDVFHITFGNRIMKQIKTYIPAYLACGGSELDALDDILARKIFRKLESQNPIYVRNEADALINKIEELFGDNAMPLSCEYINRIVRNA